MQHCMKCQRLLNTGDRVVVRMLGTFEQFTSTMHRIDADNESEELWHETCDDD